MRLKLGFSAILIAASLMHAQKSRAKLRLESSSFEDRGRMPSRLACDGPGLSPAMSWSGEPEGTRSFALLASDSDAKGFTHWLLWDIPAGTHALPEGSVPAGVAGVNDFGKRGYGGPCPPSGVHHYTFQLIALDVPSLNLPEGARRETLEGALKKHTLARAEYEGVYGRP